MVLGVEEPQTKPHSGYTCQVHVARATTNHPSVHVGKSRNIPSITLPETPLHFLHTLHLYPFICRKKTKTGAILFSRPRPGVLLVSPRLRRGPCARGGQPSTLASPPPSRRACQRWPVSCGPALNRAPATVNVYVHQSNAMCLCYMALWTRRCSLRHTGWRGSAAPGPEVNGRLSEGEKRWSVSRRCEVRGTEKLVCLGLT